MEDREPYITGGKMRDKFLTEAMGECWHDFEHKRIPCSKCGRRPSMSDGYHNISFSTWEGFGKLWEWASKQDWWLEFVKQATYLDNSPEEIEDDIFHMKLGIIDFIVPTKFAKAVFLFLENKV